MKKRLLAVILAFTLSLGTVTSVTAEEITESDQNQIAEVFLSDEIIPEDAGKVHDFSDSGISLLSLEEYDGCFGNQLDGLAKDLYDGMVEHYVENKESGSFEITPSEPFQFTVSAKTTDEIQTSADYLAGQKLIYYAVQTSFDAFKYDHPEVYWLEVTSTSYSMSLGGSSGNYLLTLSTITTNVAQEIYAGASNKISAFDAAVNAKTAEILSMREDDSRYDTLKAIHDDICDTAYYYYADMNLSKAHSAEPVFLGDGGVVCEGYAKSIKILCDKLDIPCALIGGYAITSSGEGEGHMWNYVQLEDGKWYMIDATWDDQDSYIYDTYFLTGTNEPGFSDYNYNERFEDGDLSATQIKSFVYPILNETKAEKGCRHAWDDGNITKEPTCTESGLIHYTCTECSKTKDKAIAAKGHTVVTDSAVKATCTTDGITEGKHCSVCNEVIIAQKVIPYPKTITLSATAYTYSGSAKKPTVTVKDTNGKAIAATNYTVTYDSATAIGSHTVTIKFKGNYEGTVTKTYTINPAKVTISSVSNVSTGIKVSWKKASSVTGYYIYRSVNDGSYSKIKTITSGSTVSYTDKNCTAGKKYTYKIMAYKTIGSNTYKGAYSSTLTTYRLTAPSSLTLSNKSAGKLKISWKKASGASGYEIQYATSSSMSGATTLKISSASTVSKTVSKLKKGKTYYVRIRSYKSASGKKYNSAWSSIKSLKLKK